jgi:type I restriction enzyme S subunit
MADIKTNNTLVPKLRFKEFGGEWKKNTLCNFDLKVIDGDRGVNYPNGDDFSSEGYCLFLNAKNVTKSGFSFEDKMFITKEKDELLRKGKLKRNDLVLTTRGSVGNIAYYNSNIKLENLRINSGMVIVRNENKDIDSNFIYASFFSPILDRQIKTIAFGSAQPQLTVKEINKFKLNIPSLPEQQKIASFLSAVDKKIQLLSRKKELLAQYKKAVMQQLFSGKLRFKDDNGQEFPDWEWKNGNELFDSISDKKHNSDLPILAITQEMGAVPREMINYQMSVTDSSIASYKVVQEGDFIISLRTFQGGIEYSYYKGICSPAYNILRPSSENVYRNFYRYYLKTSNYIKQLQKNLEGIRDGKMISYKYFSEIKLPFPCKKEQQKIANFLSEIDSKIESIAKQIVESQGFKKGLLQQMFV